jgi:hypothetical protein
MREEAPDTKECKMIMEQLLTTEELAKRVRADYERTTPVTSAA